MYRYEYEAVYVGGGWMDDNRKCRHREVIDQRARDGWRYAGCIPTQFSGRGAPSVMDLIFEREEADEPC